MHSILLKALVVLVVVGLIFFALHRSYRFEEEADFVILVDKVGDPVIMTIFRVNPEKHKIGNPDKCQVGGDKLYTPWNVSVFTAANEGDVLKRHHYTSYYQIFGQTFLKNCFERFMPVKIVSLYPDRGQWPFRKSDPKEQR